VIRWLKDWFAPFRAECGHPPDGLPCRDFEGFRHYTTDTQPPSLPPPDRLPGVGVLIGGKYDDSVEPPPAEPDIMSFP